MSNARKNRILFLKFGIEFSNEIADSIAKDYGISREDVYAELLDEPAEELFDYLKEPIRTEAVLRAQCN